MLNRPKTFSGRRASQNEFELRSFINLLQEQDVMRYLEIGARHGDTFHEIVCSLPAGSTAVAVDLPGGLWGTNSSRDALLRAVDDLCARGYKASSLFGDSHSTATHRLVCGRGPYDAILIDGDHTLSGVTRDWELYRSMASLIAFHDIAGIGEREHIRDGKVIEVPLFWRGISQKFEHREFIDADSKMGIGVAWT